MNKVAEKKKIGQDESLPTSDSTMSQQGVHQHMRILEAILFAAAEPLEMTTLKSLMPDGADVETALSELSAHYANRGIVLSRIGKKWAFRTAPEAAPYLKVEKEVPRKLSQAAIETLAIVAYHQPVTRPEIEEIRGKALNKGTLDMLLEMGWIQPRGKRDAPGRPVTWGTSDSFLNHFGLESVDDLPGIEELKAAGLLDARPAINVYAAMSEMDKEESEEEGETDLEDAALEDAGVLADVDEDESDDDVDDAGDDDFEDDTEDDSSDDS